MTADDVLEILDRLEAAGVRCWVHGGRGMDALLGEETRPHDDLDLAVDRDHLPRLETALPEFRRLPERDEWPSSFVIEDPRGRRVDIHPLRVDAAGDGWQGQREAPDWRWSHEDLSGRGTIKGRSVRCTSAAFEARSHTYPGHDDVDRADHERLAARFGLAPPTGPWPGKTDPKRARR